MLQEHFEIAQRHVAEATRIVGKQRELIARLESRDQDSESSRELLAAYENTLRLYIEDCDRLARELDQRPELR